MRFLRKTPPAKLRGRALVRLDFNTQDEWRLISALPTIRFLERYADKVIIMSHRGRPENVENKYSLRADALKLERHLRRPVHFVSSLEFTRMRAFVEWAPQGSILLLENLRFHRGEKKNNPKFARDLASLGDYYVNDAFAVCHRNAASVVAIAQFLPSYVGLGLEEEIAKLSTVMRRPRQPLVVVLGGGKAEDKLGVIHYFRRKAKHILLGGASANTILHLRGVDVHHSKIDTERKNQAALREVARYENVVTPVDWRVKSGAILDIGPRTEKFFSGVLKKARTILWSGPMGFIEDPRFAKGNLAIAKAAAENRRAFTLAGGGETVAFLKKYRLDKKFSFISTGGGAMIEFLAGNELPAIRVLKRYG